MRHCRLAAFQSSSCQMLAQCRLCPPFHRCSLSSVCRCLRSFLPVSSINLFNQITAAPQQQGQGPQQQIPAHQPPSPLTAFNRNNSNSVIGRPAPSTLCYCHSARWQQQPERRRPLPQQTSRWCATTWRQQTSSNTTTGDCRIFCIKPSHIPILCGVWGSSSHGRKRQWQLWWNSRRSCRRFYGWWWAGG